MNSMTGYGRGRAVADGYEVIVELSTVNRRTAEISVSISRDWQQLERTIIDALRGGILRGKLQAVVQVTPTDPGATIQWDESQIDGHLSRLRDLAQKHHILFSPDLDLLLRIAMLTNRSATVCSHPLAEAAQRAAIDALAELNAMRAREGDNLRLDCVARLQTLRAAVDSIKTLSVDTVARYREALLTRLRQADLELNLDDDRVLREIAIFADRSDISEELTRLESHLNQFAEPLGEGATNESVGRKLEFIVQEIHREFNTIGSKANNSDVSRVVIDAKIELERIREQLQNIE